MPEENKYKGKSLEELSIAEWGEAMKAKDLEIAAAKEELNHANIWAGVRATQNMILLGNKDIIAIKEGQEKAEKRFAEYQAIVEKKYLPVDIFKAKFGPVQKIVYGMVGVFLAGIGYGIVQSFITHLTASAAGK